jgi:hypothetical protein
LIFFCARYFSAKNKARIASNKDIEMIEAGQSFFWLGRELGDANLDRLSSGNAAETCQVLGAFGELEETNRDSPCPDLALRSCFWGTKRREIARLETQIQRTSGTH